MTLSVLLYAMMASAFVALVGVLVVDVIRGLPRSRQAPLDPHPDRSRAHGRWPSAPVAGRP
jgi:hypothetical protein